MDVQIVTESAVEKILDSARTLLLFGEIDDGLAYEILKKLLCFDLQKKSKITMYVNSPGGNYPDGFAIIDGMRGLRSKIRTIAVGEICSLAVPIFVLGDERLVTENTLFMLHPGFVATEDYTHFAKARIRGVEMADKLYEEIILEHTKMTKRDYDKSKKDEVWLTAEDAVKYGIADKILK